MQEILFESYTQIRFNEPVDTPAGVGLAQGRVDVPGEPVKVLVAYDPQRAGQNAILKKLNVYFSEYVLVAWPPELVRPILH